MTLKEQVREILNSDLDPWTKRLALAALADEVFDQEELEEHAAKLRSQGSQGKEK